MVRFFRFLGFFAFLLFALSCKTPSSGKSGVKAGLPSGVQNQKIKGHSKKLFGEIGRRIDVLRQ